MPSKLRVKGGKRDKGRERGRQPCEETDKKKKQEEVDTGLNTGFGLSTGHHASFVQY